MQEYTSLGTSRKIYEMFGWGDTKHIWHNLASAPHIFEREGFYKRGLTTLPPYPVPAYSLPYLLDKLPDERTTERIDIMGNMIDVGEVWWLDKQQDEYVMHWGVKPSRFYTSGYVQVFTADTPVEVAALLCLELGKQGILPGKDKR